MSWLSYLNPINDVKKLFGTDKGDEAAKQQYQQAYDLFSQLNPPSANDIYGKISSMGPSPAITNAYEGMSTDPRLKQAQLNALDQLQQVGTQGGMTAIDKARLNDIATNQATQERGAREAILQNQAMRGTSGSGNELAAELANEQGSATRASNQGTDVAAEAQKRALDAMIQSGQLGGQIRGQDYAEQARKADAANAINEFNTNNSNAFTMANRNAYGGLTQQEYEDKLRKLAGMTGQLGNIAGVDVNQGNKNAGLLGGVLGAAGKIGSAAAGGGGGG